MNFLELSVDLYLLLFWSPGKACYQSFHHWPCHVSQYRNCSWTMCTILGYFLSSVLCFFLLTSIFFFTSSFKKTKNKSQDIPALAVSLSTNAIKLYSSESGQYFGECKGHSGRIHDISFSAPASPHVLCSCSSDGTVRAWDTRSFKQVWFQYQILLLFWSPLVLVTHQLHGINKCSIKCLYFRVFFFWASLLFDWIIGSI